MPPVSRRVVAIALIAVWFYGFESSHAARVARVEKQDGSTDAVIFELPSVQAPTVGKIKRGKFVSASNQPTQGFYKVRTQDGRIGWISDQDLSFPPPPAAVPSPAPLASPDSAPSPAAQ